MALHDNYEYERRLISDEGVARMVGMSRSWVRQQRYRRRHGLEHSFDLEPVGVGSCPRYPLDEVHGWIERQRAARDRQRR